MGGGDMEEGGSISGINVTPLVDVMLVLLVIFMVTAPMIQQGVDVELPHVSAGPIPDEETALVVSVTETGEVYLNETEMTFDDLPVRVAALLEEKPNTIVYVRGDDAADYGAVVRVIALLKSGGIERLGLITEPEG